jgi:hypothetical protein
VASSGYYLVLNDNGANTGKVKACNRKCAECYGGSTFCKSCYENFTLSGSQCIYNRYYQTTMEGKLTSYAGGKGDQEQGQLFLALTPLLKEMMPFFGFQTFQEFTASFQLNSAKSGSAILGFGLGADEVSTNPSDKITKDSFKTL